MSAPAWLAGNIFIALAVLFSWPNFGHIEGSIRPVVWGVKLIKSVPETDGIETYWTFSKRDCVFEGLAFYERINGAQRRIPLTFRDIDESTQSRPKGENVAGPWFLKTSSNPSMWSATVRHRCHPLFDTITQFWPQG